LYRFFNEWVLFSLGEACFENNHLPLIFSDHLHGPIEFHNGSRYPLDWILLCTQELMLANYCIHLWIYTPTINLYIFSWGVFIIYFIFIYNYLCIIWEDILSCVQYRFWLMPPLNTSAIMLLKKNHILKKEEKCIV